MRKQLIFFVQL